MDRRSESMRKVVLHIVLLTLGCIAGGHALLAQCTSSGCVVDSNSGAQIEGAEGCVRAVSRLTTTHERGARSITDLPAGPHRSSVSAAERELKEFDLQLTPGDNRLDVRLDEIRDVLNTVTVEDRRVSNGGIRRLSGLEGAAIYESKKTEVIEVDEMAANLATNNA